MKPYSGSLILPTQIRDLRGAGVAITEAKEKFLTALPPPQEIPLEKKGEFMSMLDAIIELVDIIEPNLHKMYLLVDKEKLEELIGIMSYTQIQKQMIRTSPEDETQYIMTFDDAIQSLQILSGIEKLFSAAISWTASEEGERLRRDMNRAHAAMEASFDRWLDAVLPSNMLEIPQGTGELAPITQQFPPLQLPKRPSRTRPLPSLPPLNITTGPVQPIFLHEVDPYPVMTPPPMSPLCRYRHGTAQTCRFCHNVPRKPARAKTSRLSEYLRSLDQEPPRKRRKWSAGGNEFATLVLSGSNDIDAELSPLPFHDIAPIPSPPSFIDSMSSPGSSHGPLSPLLNPSGLGPLPLRPMPSSRRSEPPTAPRKKAPFWVRVLKEFFPFL
ncbi:hypothetical protein BDW22DRAFT_1353229 [Trametopsis cervina]|nr:hypothetical protein BDW22DRAFT_1353229 [Trametopsis cervina]